MAQGVCSLVDKRIVRTSALVGIVIVAILLRLYGLNHPYFYVQDSTIQISGVKRLFLEATYPYWYHAPPGPGLALLPFLVPFDFSLSSAQVGVAFYGVLLVILTWLVVRAIGPTSTLAPYLAAFLVAINPMLVVSSRVILFDTMQVVFILAFLLILTAKQATSLPKTLLVFALGALLVVMKIPNVLVAGLGLLYLLAEPLLKSWPADVSRNRWLHTSVGLGLLLLILGLYPSLATGERAKIATGAGGQFRVDFILPNLRAMSQAFGAPLNTEPTAVFFRMNALGFPSWKLALALGQALLAVMGIAYALRRKWLETLLVAGCAIGVAAFYAGYHGWQTRYVLLFLVVQLVLVSLGVEALVEWLRKASRAPTAIVVASMAILFLLAAASLMPAIMTDIDSLISWGTEDSMHLNDAHLFPADVMAIRESLAQHPEAYVISSMASAVDILDSSNTRQMLDLHRFGIERGVTEESVGELGLLMDEVLESGKEILYIPTWHEIDDPWLEKGFRKYLYFITSDYDAFPEYIGQNEYRRSMNRFLGRPYVHIYLIRAKASTGSAQNHARGTRASKWIYTKWNDPGQTYNGITLIYPLLGKRLYWVNMDGTIAKFMELPEAIQHAKQLENGHILVRTVEVLQEMNGDGDLLWEYLPAGHHDAVRSRRGTTFVLEKRWSEEWLLRYDVIVEVDREGSAIWDWNSLDHFDPRKDHCPQPSEFGGDAGTDWLHTNAIDLFPDGDLLVSVRNLNKIVRIDYPSGQILWSWGEGILGHQHAPEILANGNILLFDNQIHRTAEKGGCARHTCVSRVLEIDPQTGVIVWQFGPLSFSPAFGDADRLPNGNTLITNGFPAQVWEVTPQGEVVWRAWSLERAFIPYFRGGMEINFLYRAQRVTSLP